MLEQTAYQLPKFQKREQPIYFTSKSLENLSALPLYSSGKIFLPNGQCVDGDSVGFMGNVGSNPAGSNIRANENLTIRDLPALGIQLHIHEEEGGKPKLINYGRIKLSELNSYDAAMADGGAPAYEAMTVVERLAKFLAPNGLWGCNKKD